MGFRINTNVAALNAKANAHREDKTAKTAQEKDLALVLGLTPQQMMLQGWL
ncbi:hypothetical protein ECGR_4902 [Escherichia coli]|nr:hypothetical protein ECGR_4902 [Escherichia coli]